MWKASNRTISGREPGRPLRSSIIYRSSNFRTRYCAHREHLVEFREFATSLRRPRERPARRAIDKPRRIRLKCERSRQARYRIDTRSIATAVHAMASGREADLGQRNRQRSPLESAKLPPTAATRAQAPLTIAASDVLSARPEEPHHANEHDGQHHIQADRAGADQHRHAAAAERIESRRRDPRGGVADQTTAYKRTAAAVASVSAARNCPRSNSSAHDRRRQRDQPGGRRHVHHEHHRQTPRHGVADSQR